MKKYRNIILWSFNISVCVVMAVLFFWIGWGIIPDNQSDAIRMIMYVSGLFSGMAYLYLYSICESLVKKWWERRKSLKVEQG